MKKKTIHVVKLSIESHNKAIEAGFNVVYVSTPKKKAKK